MNTRALGFGVVVCACLGWATVAACVGDDPSSSPSPTDDGGSDVAVVDAPPDTGDTSPPGPAFAVDIAVGNGFACAALMDGAVACWGVNDLGQTAQPVIGDSKCGNLPCREPTRVPGLTNVVRVAAGGESACAITSVGAVYCWGANDTGQLGHASAMDESCPGGRKCVRVPTKVDNITDVVEMAISQRTSCAITKTGRVFCWGANASGQLGRGIATATFELPGPSQSFDTGSPAVHVAVDTGGSGHFCASRKDGTVWCWGRATAGATGVASTYCDSGMEECVPTPSPVNKAAATPLTSVESIAATDGATCVSLSGGDVWCWGYKAWAVADHPDGGADVTPKVATAVGKLSSLAGSYLHACGLASGGVVKCWGSNTGGALGVPPSAATDTCRDTTPCNFEPRTVPNIFAKSVAGAVFSSMALTADGKVFGWGLNNVGQLGHLPLPTEIGTCGATACSPTPVEVPLP
jgi:alpha-tubulin suppressor-like RCC1 family protein